MHQIRVQDKTLHIEMRVRLQRSRQLRGRRLQTHTLILLVGQRQFCGKRSVQGNARNNGLQSAPVADVQGELSRAGRQASEQSLRITRDGGGYGGSVRGLCLPLTEHGAQAASKRQAKSGKADIPHKKFRTGILQRSTGRHTQRAGSVFRIDGQIHFHSEIFPIGKPAQRVRRQQSGETRLFQGRSAG